MSFRSHIVWSLCLAGLFGTLPLFAFADPEKKSDKSQDKGKPESVKVEASDKNPGKTPDKKTDSSAKPKPGAKPGPKGVGKNQEMTPEREQAALAFLEEHHPKLAKLIVPLKTSNFKEYQKAIKELSRTTERLTGIRTKDPARYELELDAWKIQSHVRLLAARMTMEDDPEIESELRAMLKKKAENQLKLLQNEREFLQSRLKQVETQIERQTKSQDELVQQEYDRLLKRTDREKQAIVPKANPGKPVTNRKGNNPKPSSTVGVEK